jgi:hypothetical protein
MNANVGVNQFRIERVSGKDVFQYDVCAFSWGAITERACC